MRELPSIENLQCFIAAAEQLHFRRAAEQVFLTPAAFSQRIKLLEEQLGHALFERSTRQVRLTQAGMRLLPVARAAVRASLRCVEQLETHGKKAPIRLTLGTRFELGLSWVVPSLTSLPENLSHLDVHLYFGSGEDILARLERRTIDAVITSAPQAHGAWSSTFLHKEHYVFVGAPSLLEALPLDRVEDASRHTLLDINMELPLMRYVHSVLPRPMRFANVRACGAGGAMLELALAGLGVAVLPLYMASTMLEQGRLQRIMPHVTPLSDTFRLISYQDHLHAHAISELAEFFASRPLR